jgi:hypothetical protein
MKTILLAAFSLTAAACTDPNVALCVSTLECLGESTESATTECEKKNAEEETDDNARCQAEGDDVIACLNSNGTCDSIGPVKVFGVKAVQDGGACSEENQANVKCLAG